MAKQLLLKWNVHMNPEQNVEVWSEEHISAVDSFIQVTSLGAGERCSPLQTRILCISQDIDINT